MMKGKNDVAIGREVSAERRNSNLLGVGAVANNRDEVPIIENYNTAIGKNEKIGYQCPHPLFQSIILGNVFAFLDSKELQKVRTVCNFWMEMARKVKELREELILSGDKEVFATLENLKTTSKKICDLELCWVNLDGKHVEELLSKAIPNLSFFRLVICKVSSMEGYYTLMRKVLPEIRSLDQGTIKCIDESGNSRCIQLFPIPKFNSKSHIVFKNLTYLEIGCINIDGNGPVDTAFSSICKSFPNLRELILHRMNSEDPGNLKNIRMRGLKRLTIKMIPNVEKLPEPGFYQHCGCDDCLNEILHGETDGGIRIVHLKMLLNLNLNLEEFHLQNLNRGTDPKLFNTFLQSQSKSLTSLTLEQTSGSSEDKCSIQAPSPFPLALPKLKKLAVDRVFIKNLNHVFDSCENVEDVSLDFFKGADWRQILTARIKPRPNLKTWLIRSIQPEILKKITPIWENLTNLNLLNCTDEMLEIVFAKAKKLKNFSANKSMTRPFSATAFTGLMEKDMKMLMDSEVNVFEDCVTNLRGERQFLGALNGLRSLTLGMYPIASLKYLAIFAFSYCKDLDVITFRNPDEEALLDDNFFQNFIPDDLKLFMEKEAGYISIPILVKGRPAIEFARAEFLPFYNGGQEGMENTLARLNVSGSLGSLP